MNKVYFLIYTYNTFLILRYLTAFRDFEEGETIFEEDALVVGPNGVSTFQCLECASKVPILTYLYIVECVRKN